jgi:hypothetical protein
MKRCENVICLILLAVLLVFFTGCIVAGGKDPSGATWAIGMAGTDADELDVTTAGLHGKKINQSKGMKIVADTVKKMWDAYLLLKGVEFITGQYYTLEGAKVNQTTTLELEKLRNASNGLRASRPRNGPSRSIT